jgi:nitroreductase
MNTSVFEFLAARRSVKPDRLAAPGPTPEQLRSILTAGTRVPDHKKLNPWRFIVFEGEARAKMGELFARACEKEDRQPPSPVRLETERGRFTRAPLVLAVVSLSDAMACYNWNRKADGVRRRCAAGFDRSPRFSRQ